MFECLKHKHIFLPRRISRTEKSLLPSNWTRIIANYSQYRKKAIKEAVPGDYTFLAGLLVAMVKRDRQLVNTVVSLVKDNVPEHFSLSLAGGALCDLDFKEEGLAMLRKAVEIKPKHSYILSLASETNDLDEKMSLAEKVLSDNPSDCDALRHLAFAKYFKGEIEEAERITDDILMNDPTNVYALEAKGNMCFIQEKYKDALDEILKIKLKPLPVSLSLKIFHCHYLLGSTRKAKKIAKKLRGKVNLACDIDPMNRPAIELIAKVLES